MDSKLRKQINQVDTKIKELQTISPVYCTFSVKYSLTENGDRRVGIYVARTPQPLSPHMTFEEFIINFSVIKKHIQFVKILETDRGVDFIANPKIGLKLICELQDKGGIICAGELLKVVESKFWASDLHEDFKNGYHFELQFKDGIQCKKFKKFYQFRIEGIE